VSEAPAHLAPKPALRRFIRSELRVVGGLEVGILGVVSTVIVDKACKFDSERRAVWPFKLR